MARSSLAKSSSKLNLSRRQTELLRKIISVGNQMSELMYPDRSLPVPKDRAKLERKLGQAWSNLIVAFAKTLTLRGRT
jgi:hypothetical protein